MLTKKDQVYLSSTFSDLIECRLAAKNALEPAGFEIEHMERYSAFDEWPIDKCLQDVRACDYYVLIVAHRYGYVPSQGNPLHLSITHLEYREALRTNKPIFAFILESGDVREGNSVDGEFENSESPIRRFRDEVTARHGVAFFKTPEDFAQKLLQALSASIAQTRNRRKLRATVVLGIAMIGIAALTHQDLSEDPSVTTADWLRAISTAQEKKLAETQLSATPTRITSARRNVEYLSKIVGDASAWHRFQDAFGAANRMLARLYPSYKPGSLRRDLVSGNVSKIVETLLSMPTQSVRDAAERHFLIGAFLEIDGRLEEAFGAFEKAAVAEPLNRRYSTAALELATNTGQVKEAIALAEAQRRALLRQPVSPDDLASVMGYEALARWFSGESENSKDLFEQAISIAKTHPTRARLFNDRVPIFNEAGDLLGAEHTLAESALLYGCSPPDQQLGLISSLLNLAAALTRQGRTADAEEYLSHIDSLFQSEPYLSNPFPIYRAQRDVVAGLVDIANGDGISAEVAFRNAILKYASMNLQSSFLATRARLYLGKALLLRGGISEGIAELQNAVQQNRGLFTDSHVETATARVYLAEGYLLGGQLRSASMELAAVGDFMNKSPNREWKFLGKYEMLSSLLKLKGFGSADHSNFPQNQYATLLALENGCKKQSALGAVSREAANCWSQALSLSGGGGNHKDQISQQILKIEQALSEGRQKKEKFVGVWSKKCPP